MRGPSLLLLLAAACGGKKDPPAVDAPVANLCAGSAGAVELDIPYATISGVDPALLSLDVYRTVRPAGCGPAPVVVWVHGGAWAIGDKGNVIADKVQLFNAAGWHVVSVNYRLSPSMPSTDPARVMYPIHPMDVASTIAWVRDHASELEADLTRVALTGHSAGAHLVALVATDPQFLGAHQIPTSRIACVGSYDTEAYDIAAAYASGSAMQRTILENAFGTDPAVHAAASPITHVMAGAALPPFQVVVRGAADRMQIQTDFIATLEGIGVTTTTIDAAGLSHEEVNSHIGQAGDTVMTAPVMAFLTTCLE